jgi:ribulose-bisphosphate carboxylase large chain
MPRILVTYRVKSDAASVEARAREIATEQSVEMPLPPIDDDFVKAEIIGQVDGISDRGGGAFDVRIGLSPETVGDDAGQLLNMLFGNTSLHDDVSLLDVVVPPEFARSFGGPNVGVRGLRESVDAKNRALTCSALKPQGLSARDLGALAGRLAAGGIDYIKDDHGLADQAYSPFADRVRACAEAIARANKSSGHATRYVPSLSGDLASMRKQVGLARGAGVDTLLIAPMIVGRSTFRTLVKENAEIAFISHPAMAGAQIAPPLLAKLFRLLGADAVVFPSFGGRFGYSPDTCRAIADAALGDWHRMRSALPVPAGGMTLNRVSELLGFYGRDVMLLIGGSLLSAKEKLTAETAKFTDAVKRHEYR